MNAETFWLNQLINLQPISLPYAPKTVLSQEPAHYVSYSIIVPNGIGNDLKFEIPLQLNSLLIAFITYLARLNDNYQFDLALTYPKLKQNKDNDQSFFTSYIPLHIQLDEQQNFEMACQAIKKQIELTQIYKTNLPALIAQHPDLKTNPELQSRQPFPIVIKLLDDLELLEPVLESQLTVGITQDGTVCRWWCNTTLWQQTDIERMAHHFETFLNSVLSQPTQPLAYLPLLTSSEQHQFLVTWNDTDVEYPQDKCFYQLFEEQVERTPDAVAVVFYDNQQGKYRHPTSKITYQELNIRVNQLAYYLQTMGVGPDVLVGLYLDRSIDMVVGLLAILKAGGAYVPLDPTHPLKRTIMILKDSRIKLLLTIKNLALQLPQHLTTVLYLDEEWAKINLHKKTNPPNNVQLNNLAYVIYTSGSTGKPKGVQIEHQALTNFLYSMQNTPGLTAQDILLAVTTISFDIAALEIYLPLIVGAKIVLTNQTIVADATELMTLLGRCGATIMQCTPATWQMLLTAGWLGNEQLKILCGGEALSKTTSKLLLKRSTPIWNLYGPTETTIWSSVYKVGNTENLTDSGSGVESIGYPIANTQMYILDKWLQPVPIGISGDLYIGGDGVARGYFNQPKLTTEKFIPNPFSKITGSRLYNTGDLARYLPDGNIDFLGRLDYQVKIRGFRIELGEIEEILGQHPAIQQVIVIIQDSQFEDKQLVAYIIVKDNLLLTNSELHYFLADKLPEYMIPTAFVILDKFPLTPNKKINRQALPKPTYNRPSLHETFIAPRNAIEEVLARIWQEVLGIKQIGVQDKFLNLGGHSLLATQILVRIQKTLRITLSLRALFDADTIEGLAETLIAHEVSPGKTLAIARLRQKLSRMSPEEIQITLQQRKKAKKNE